MYRRPILCTLYGVVDFLNVLKKYIMYLYVMVICDINLPVLGRNVYITAQYWDIMYTLRPSTGT